MYVEARGSVLKKERYVVNGWVWEIKKMSDDETKRNGESNDGK